MISVVKASSLGFIKPVDSVHIVSPIILNKSVTFLNDPEENHIIFTKQINLLTLSIILFTPILVKVFLKIVH